MENNIEKKIEKLINILGEKIEFLKSDCFDILPEDESVYLIMPGEDEGISFTFEELVEFKNEISEFQVINQGRFRTKTKSYQIIKAESSDLEFYLSKISDFKQVYNGVKISIIESSTYVGIGCLELGSYHDDFGSGYQSYLTIEICYSDKSKKISIKEETELIYSYLYEIADSTGFVFHLSKVNEYNSELEDKINDLIYAESEGVETDEEEINLKPLLEFNEGMRLFVAALQTTDEELKLLNFYKILEYFAPIVINIESYNLLAKKLDSPKVLNPNRSFLKSIFDLVNSTNQRFRDEDLIKSVFNTCFDLVDIFNYLPQSIKSKVLGIIKEKEISYNLDNNKLQSASNIIGSTLYSTRNMVAHAKSNYIPTGNECPKNEISQLNVFLKETTARTIRWYTKLPDNLK